MIKTGDIVTLIHGTRHVQATVWLASSNEDYLLLSFDAVVDRHVSGMALARERDGTYQAIFGGTKVKILCD